MNQETSLGVAASAEDLLKMQELIYEVERIIADSDYAFSVLRGLTDVNWRSYSANAYREKVYEVAARRGSEIRNSLQVVAQNLRDDLQRAYAGQ